MKTIPKEAQMTQFVDRLAQGDHEKFKQEYFEHIRKRQEAKKRKNKEAEKPVESADN